MYTIEDISNLCITSPSKIVFLIIDGLGGLPDFSAGNTELETARTPNLDKLAKDGICGLSDPVGPGITPGSGPGHLALFGYDPTMYTIGRGVLEGLGIGFELYDNDVAARGNFCTVDSSGIITDRRAGRIDTQKCAELCELISDIELEGVNLFIMLNILLIS
jgi:2,3-bisphosphoglycerate-independent phosphoglycerate mutase